MYRLRILAPPSFMTTMLTCMNLSTHSPWFNPHCSQEPLLRLEKVLQLGTNGASQNPLFRCYHHDRRLMNIKQGTSILGTHIHTGVSLRLWVSTIGTPEAPRDPGRTPPAHPSRRAYVPSYILDVHQLPYLVIRLDLWSHLDLQNRSMYSGVEESN